MEIVRDDAKLSAWVLPAVERVLARWGGDVGQIAAIAFGAGPGSFTGVRTACNTAQSLVYAWRDRCWRSTRSMPSRNRR